MAAGVEVTDDRRVLDRILREVAKLGGATVTVGVHGDTGIHGDGPETVAQVSATHEFGSGHVPERSFLR